MKEPDKQILFDSPEAARYKTGLSGWVSRNGLYFGDGQQSEDVARYAGCTHVACRTCGTPTEKGWTACCSCRAANDLARYEAMPRAEWDGKAMLYSRRQDRYYANPDDAADDLEEDEALSSLQLVICEPSYVRQLEPDYFGDDLPDDTGHVPDEVTIAMDAFNKAVAGIVISWSPGKIALQSLQEL